MQQIPLHTRKPEWQGLVSLVDDEDFDRVNQHRWNVMADNNGRFYAKARVNGEFVLMHRFILGASPLDPQVDHVDHDGLHNWRSNIRFATRSQNQANRRPCVVGTSSYKGVSFQKRTAHWKAQARLNDQLVHLGYFDSEIEAALAYNKFALEHHGEFAFLNVITVNGDPVIEVS